MTANSTDLMKRTICFSAIVTLIATAVWLFNAVANVRILGEYSSQTLLIPFFCGYLIWNERDRIFVETESGLRSGAQFAVAAAIAALGALYLRTGDNAYLFSAFSLLSAIFFVLAAFAAIYGKAALRRAAFPMILLLFAIPFPDSLVQRIISLLQAQSASLSATLFSLIGIPVFKQGFLLTVPGVTIEVARECSGINSSIALVLTMLIVARQSINSNWRRALFVAATIPLSILKNAIRITTLTVLALRVDPSFLTGKLHHQGGFVFYLVAMALMYPLWKVLKAGDSIDGSEPLQKFRKETSILKRKELRTIG